MEAIMKYRRLGKTGLNVSVIGVGTWQFGGEWGKQFSQADADAILGAARDQGINLIDTAECYGDHLSERLIGAFIRGERDRWVIASKFGHQFHSHMNRTDHWTAQEVEQQLNDSLRALQTDYIDVYQAHGDRVLNESDELWAMLQRQQQAGKIRHIGISISSNTTNNVIPDAAQRGVAVIQLVYNRLERKPEAQVLPACIEHDLGVLARVPLASGYLSGKYPPGTRFTDPADVRASHKPEDVERKLQETAAIKAAEVPAGVEMAQWALAWCLQHEGVTSVIPGMKDTAQVAANVSAAALDLVRTDHRLSVNR
jgi:aryl-alcohol dehydrogenase-like predicted oxidoreductase